MHKENGQELLFTQCEETMTKKSIINLQELRD